MTATKEIHRGSDGYSTMRLETYDFNRKQWKKLLKRNGNRSVNVAESVSPQLRVLTVLLHDTEDDYFFVTRWQEGGQWKSYNIPFSNEVEPMRQHRKLAKDIVRRIETMEQIDVSALMDGAL